MTKTAYILDLDYTLYDAGQFYRSVFQVITRDLAGQYGREPGVLNERLLAKWRERTSRYGHLFDEFLSESGLPGKAVGDMLDTFRSHQPHLELYDDAERFLSDMSGQTPLGIVTDGNSMTQRNKVKALGLAGRVDAIVFTGDGGPAWQKPSSLPFLAICNELGIEPAEATYIGDNPRVDSGGPHRIGMRAVRIRRGEFQDLPSTDGHFAAEIRLLTDLVEGKWLALNVTP